MGTRDGEKMVHHNFDNKLQQISVLIFFVVFVLFSPPPFLCLSVSLPSLSPPPSLSLSPPLSLSLSLSLPRSLSSFFFFKILSNPVRNPWTLPPQETPEQ